MPDISSGIRFIGVPVMLKECSQGILKTSFGMDSNKAFSITKDLTIPMLMVLTICLYDYDEKMSVVSTERIREELLKCFKHDTLKTLRVLGEYPLLNSYLFKNNLLWLKPTMEQ
jgi:hypothetical protein